MIYLANAFSPSMLPKLPSDVEFLSVDIKEFCQAVNRLDVNAIGHQGTVDLVNTLCGSNLKVNRISINANIGDEIYIIALSLRLEEGKILKSDEIQKLYEEGKIKFVKAKVYGPILKELSECGGVCDEATYDTLAYRAKVKEQ